MCNLTRRLFFSRNGSNSSHVSTITLWQETILTSNSSYFNLRFFATKFILLYWSEFYFHLGMSPTKYGELALELGVWISLGRPRSFQLRLAFKAHSCRWVVTSYNDLNFDILFLFPSPAFSGTTNLTTLKEITEDSMFAMAINRL